MTAGPGSVSRIRNSNHDWSDSYGIGPVSVYTGGNGKPHHIISVPIYVSKYNEEQWIQSLASRLPHSPCEFPCIYFFLLHTEGVISERHAPMPDTIRQAGMTYRQHVKRSLSLPFNTIEIRIRKQLHACIRGKLIPPVSESELSTKMWN